MTRISDMTELTTLPATGAFVPVEKAGSTTNFRYNLGNVPTTDSLFVNASSLSVPTGFNMVATSGYSTLDVGGAIYVYDAAVNAAYVIANPRSSFIETGGRGFRLSLEQDITPEMLGATGLGVADDYAAFAATINLLPAGTIHVPAGTYNLLTEPTWGTKSIIWRIAPGASFAGSGVGPGKFPGTALSALVLDSIEFANPLMDYDWLNEGVKVNAVNTGSPTFGPNNWTVVSAKDAGFYTASVQRVAAAISAAPWISHALRMKVEAAGDVRISDQGLIFYQMIEAARFGNLQWGTSSAKPISIGFWVRCSITGTFAFSLQNQYDPSLHQVPDRSWVKDFTITAANTWQFVKFENIPGDVAGTWMKTGNLGAMSAAVTLHYPAVSPPPAYAWVNFGTSGQWTANNALALGGETNLTLTLNATFDFTGLQANVGAALSDRAPLFGLETQLPLMRRNFQKSYHDGVAIGTIDVDGSVVWSAPATGTYQAYIPIRLKAAARKENPGFTLYASHTGAQGKVSLNGADFNTGLTVISPTDTGATLQIASRAWTVGDVIQFHWTAEGPWM